MWSQQFQTDEKQSITGGGWGVSYRKACSHTNANVPYSVLMAQDG